MLLSLVCAALASTAAVFAALLATIDKNHRLRSDKLLIRHGRDSGVAFWIQSQSVKASSAMAFVSKTSIHLQIDASWVG